MIPPPPRSTLFPYTTLFRSIHVEPGHQEHVLLAIDDPHVAFLVHLADVSGGEEPVGAEDRKSTRLNSSHSSISYAVFCLKKKKNKITDENIQPQQTIRNCSA